jgi:hypothetical protein
LWVDLLGGGAAGAAAGILWTIPAHRRGPSSVNACVLRRLLLCGVVLWIDLRGDCTAAAAACRARPPNAAVSVRPDDNTRDSRRRGVMIFDFPALSRVQVLLQLNFAETSYYLSKTSPKK